MTWNEIKAAISVIGVTGFKSYEHFENWMQWENDDKKLEKRIKTALNGSQFFKPEKRNYTRTGGVHKRQLHNEEC